MVDWRNSTYTEDRQHNLLDDILETPQDIDEVQLHGDISKLSKLGTHEFYPIFWNPDNLHKTTWETPQLRQEQQDLIKSCQDKNTHETWKW